MGGLVQTLFGGKKESSSATQDSSNQAFGVLSPLLTGNIQQGSSAMSQISRLLGIGGTPEEQGMAGTGYQNYLDSTGYQAMLDGGSKAITGNAAASGLLRSGSTLKGLTNYGQNAAATHFNDYLKQLSGLGEAGTNAAGVLSSAGNVNTQRSTSSGKASNGIINSLFG